MIVKSEEGEEEDCKKMEATVSFKVYMTRENDPTKKEVRRFGIEADLATNFLHLRKKIQSIFPALRGKLFSITWKDSDSDDVTISSDEELRIALNETMMNDVRQLYVLLRDENAEETPPKVWLSQQHIGIHCDGCKKSMHGFRYKCIQCPDYDLCSECESCSTHPEHKMIRLPTPLTNQRLRNLLNQLGQPSRQMSNAKGKRAQGRITKRGQQQQRRVQTNGTA